MRNAEHLELIKGIVTKTLSADFERVKILDVKVDSDVDSDGDDVLRIIVIFEGTRKDVDARKLSEAVRQVRPKLERIGEGAFPLFSFVSKGDIRSSQLAPA